jgi:hypothetical protein
MVVSAGNVADGASLAERTDWNKEMARPTRATHGTHDYAHDSAGPVDVANGSSAVVDGESAEPVVVATGSSTAADGALVVQTGEHRPTPRPTLPLVINAAVVRDICHCLYQYFDLEASRNSVRDIVEEAYKSTDGNYGLAQALEWANGFRVPQEALDSDMRLFQASNRDFDRMVARRLKLLHNTRFNRERVAAVISPENPELARLLDLADGMQVPLPTGFRPNGQRERPPLRAKYIQAHTVVNKLYHDSHKAGLAFYLPIDIATREVIGSNFIPAHWTPNKDKVQGRALIDGSDDTVVDSTLNGPEVRDKANDLWGVIQHPTITDIVNMILEFWDEVQTKYPEATWDDLVLWKMDLKGAYTLLSFRAERAKLFGIELVNDDGATAAQFAIFLICGFFGWTATPAAFQVVTRALLFELRKTTRGRVTKYVDDTMGVCLRWHLEEEKANAKALFIGLLGPTAVADHKTLSGRRLDNIGYTPDLDLQRLTISRKNFLNTLYGYFSVQVDDKIPVATIERLASWGSRYSTICRHMTVFNRALYAVIYRRDPQHALNRNVCVHLTPAAKLAIRVWRATLCALHLDETRFARSFESFRACAVVPITGEFDSSLEGSGNIIYEVQADGQETKKGGARVSLRSLEFKDDSSHQNTAEFIGVILTIVTMVRLGIKVRYVKIRGDSVTALTWATEERFRSDLVTNAATVFVLLMVSLGVEIVSQTHISKDDNVICDALSRPSLGKTLGELGLKGIPILDLNDDPLVKEILQLCDPRVPRDSDGEFADLWSRIRRVAAELCAINNRL